MPVVGERRSVERKPAPVSAQGDNTGDHDVKQRLSPLSSSEQSRMHRHGGIVVTLEHPLRHVPDINRAPCARADVPGRIQP